MMITKVPAILAAMGLIAAMVSISCESTPDKKIEAAKENLQEAKEDVKEAVNDALTAYKDEWQAFKFDAETAIRDNEYTVNGYKKKMVKAGATQKAIFNKRIDELERRNEELKDRLKEYHDEGKGKWEEFKQGFNHDMEALGKSLKDLTVGDK